jgi:DNA-directed RNA polymerase specialized sigma24 family protein
MAAWGAMSLQTQTASFHTTRWTRVCKAKDGTEEGRRALADLCDCYYEPVIAFLRCELRDVEAAREAAHGFFAELLAKANIQTALPEHGRFRSYLLGSVKHFLSHQREAAARQKRGGGMEALTLDDTAVVRVPDASTGSPEDAFDRQWAVTTLAQAQERLRQEHEREGKGSLFEALSPWLTGDAGHGDQAELAARLGMSEGTVKSHVSRLRGRFRALLKEEVASTLLGEAAVEDELGALLAALRKK